MTIRLALQNQLKKDMEKIPKYVTNQNGLKLTFDPARGLYVGVDDKKQEWIELIQDTQVPMFWYNCPNKMEKDGKEKLCNVPNMTPIFEDGQKKFCTGCKKEFTVKLVVSEEQPCHELLEELRKEK